MSIFQIRGVASPDPLSATMAMLALSMASDDEYGEAFESIVEGGLVALFGGEHDTLESAIADGDQQRAEATDQGWTVIAQMVVELGDTAAQNREAYVW